ncbi:MAG: acyl-CoA dehydrogenase family protein [Deinococcota bacterium]
MTSETLPAQSPPCLTADQALAVAQELARDIASRADDADKRGELPPADVTALKRSGYLGLPIAQEFGGAGLSLYDCVRVQLELAKGSTSTALVAAMHTHIMGHAREARPWTAHIFTSLSEAAVRGELINAVASEPKLGSPSRGGLPETAAVLEGEYLRLNGHKTWTTGGSYLDHLLVRATLQQANDEVATMIWVPANTPGVRIDATWGDSLSLRASDSHDLFFEDVIAPVANILQPIATPAPDAPKPAGNTVWFPMLMAATYFGAALAARDTTVHYAQTRVPTALGKPIATLPKIQRQLGEVEIALHAAKTVLLEVARAWHGDVSQQQAFIPKVATAKHLATETALQVTEQCLKIAGGASIGRELPLERYFRDVRAGIMHPPSGDTALELVGKAVLEV